MPYKSNIWKMYFFRFLRNMHFVAAVLVPFFTEWGGISFFQMMVLQSIFVFSVFLLEIPTGAVADHLGRKTSLFFGAIFTVIAPIAYSLIPSFPMFVVAELCWAMGVALVSGADQAIVYDSLRKIRKEKISKKVLGKLESFGLFSMLIAGPIGGVIAATLGLRYTMMLTAAPSFIAIFVALSLKEPATKKKIESKRYLKNLLQGVAYFKSHKILKILAFDSVSTGALVFMLIWIYQPFLRSLDFPLLYLGIVHAGILAGQIAVASNFEKLEKLFGSRKRYLLMSAVIPGICFFLLGFTAHTALAIFLIIIIAGLGLSRMTLFDNYMHKYIESHHRATVMSSINMLKGFAEGIVYPFVGLMMELSLGTTFVLIGISIVILALISRVEEGHLID